MRVARIGSSRGEEVGGPRWAPGRLDGHVACASQARPRVRRVRRRRAGRSDGTRPQRSIWQPSTRVSFAQTRRPSTRPLTSASLRAAVDLGARRALAAPAGRLASPAGRARGTPRRGAGGSLPTGSQRSVHRTRSAGRAGVRAVRDRQDGRRATPSDAAPAAPARSRGRAGRASVDGTSHVARHVTSPRARLRRGRRLRSARATHGQEDPRHGRRRVHRHDARAAARRRERGPRDRQPPPRRPVRDGARRAPELPASSRATSSTSTRLTELAAGCTHIVHAAGIAGVDTVLASPVRTMRVNVIGTYNALEAAVATQRHARAARRVLDERGVRPARVQRPGGHVTIDRLGRRGPLDVRGLEARGRAHGARVPLGARPPVRLGAPVQHLRPRPDRRRRDPRVHRGRPRRARPRDPRRRLADPRLVLRRRHGRGAPARARAPRRRSARASTSATRARPSRSTTSRRGSSGSPAARARSGSCRSSTRTSSFGSRTSQKARSLLGFEARVELDEGLERTIAWYRARLGAAGVSHRAHPARASRRRRGGARRGRARCSRAGS